MGGELPRLRVAGALTVREPAATLRPVQPIRRLVFIVSPRHRELYESLRRTFARDDSVEVVLDRRDGERRRRAEPAGADRRRTNRRRNVAVQKKLATRGYAVVGVLTSAARRS